MPLVDPVARNEYTRKYWANNRDHLTSLKAERRKAQRDFIALAKSKPCTDCGVQYSAWVMQFDHVRGEKSKNVSELARNTVSWKTIEIEIAKCEVVCANCHADRTYRREHGSE